MKIFLSFVLIYSAIGINGQNVNDFELFSQCDRTVGSGVATCMQYFSPIKFVTDFLNGDKDSLCCTHFRQNACIRGVRDAVRVAKAANLCPDSYADELVTGVTDSAVNQYVLKTCRTFNARKCVMDSVGDVVNTIQGFFTPQQQKPVIPQLIRRVPQVFRSGGNAYSVDNNNYKSHNYDNDYDSAGTSLFNPIRELINRRAPIPVTSSTEKPQIYPSIRDIYDRQYIPEASDVRPVKDDSDDTNNEQLDDTLRSLFSGLLGNTRAEDKNNDQPSKNKINEKEDKPEGEPSLLGSIGSFLNSGLNNMNRNATAGSDFFGDIFGNTNQTGGQDLIKGIADSIN